jgi:hypothetical protein
MTAGALAASQPAGRKGRRGSRKAGSGRGRGSGGGSSGGAKKRKGRGRRQGWRTIAGQKVRCLPTAWWLHCCVLATCSLPSNTF